MIIDVILERFTCVSAPAALALLVSSTVALWMMTLFYSYYFHPYADIPGPFWAKLSRFWLVRQVLRGDIHNTQRARHEKYGPIVRMAPDEVSISDPAALKRDEKIHAQRRRFVNNLYSLSSILESESYVDACIMTFKARLEEFVVQSDSFDLGLWLQMFAFDVIGELFDGKQFGFMEDRHDYQGYIKTLDTLLPAVATSCVLPFYLRPLQVLGHLISPLHKALKGYDDIVVAAKETVARRQRQVDKGTVERLVQNRPSDLLDKLFNIAGSKDDFTLADVATEAWVSLFAGSDTTAIAMRAILFHIIRSPKVYERLLAEIDQASAQGLLSNPANYSEAIKLPYFIACCKEGFRVHPSVGMSMPRHVPPAGVNIAGRYFPGGSRVGMSAHVVHFDKGILGCRLLQP
ncbi:cytochrome P450 monooxygenase oxidoreductase [Fusarium tjaetaba]|uniref:Cytochrome P450 monooxygenase oxidoreductase n=1 Tax=Fusarium tjaetaba TaxID=1567544 RepID=A0A8H5QK94_9HYPO|nr:cytochrome P450 monooxygenase oxidoreductase [Fusarium tjaetaba]KAF5616785.1 cytochrome P450 monooxygenase oxidoreductase [Fusarium tjaetaba]